MNIVLKGNGNVYEQIVEQYKKYIDLKILLENDKLPSCRVLAKELGINPNTVERAYKVVEEDGYIKVIPKKGVYVSKLVKKKDNQFIFNYIEEIKSKNISYEELLNIIDEVYGR